MCCSDSNVLTAVQGQSNIQCHLHFTLTYRQLLLLAWINFNSDMYRVYHKDVPIIFYVIFRYNYHLHDHYTRAVNYLHEPLTSANLSKTGICYQGVIVWNIILCADINSDISEQSFKIMFKNISASTY